MFKTYASIDNFPHLILTVLSSITVKYWLFIISLGELGTKIWTKPHQFSESILSDVYACRWLINVFSVNRSIFGYRTCTAGFCISILGYCLTMEVCKAIYLACLLPEADNIRSIIRHLTFGLG